MSAWGCTGHVGKSLFMDSFCLSTFPDSPLSQPGALLQPLARSARRQIETDDKQSYGNFITLCSAPPFLHSSKGTLPWYTIISKQMSSREVILKYLVPNKVSPIAPIVFFPSIDVIHRNIIGIATTTLCHHTSTRTGG